MFLSLFRQVPSPYCSPDPAADKLAEEGKADPLATADGKEAAPGPDGVAMAPLLLVSGGEPPHPVLGGAPPHPVAADAALGHAGLLFPHPVRLADLTTAGAPPPDPSDSEAAMIKGWA